MILKQALAIAALLLCGPAALAQTAPPPQSAPSAEEVAVMDRIEHDVRLPRGAPPLAQFGRSYAWLGDRSVVAIYEHVQESVAGRRWVAARDLPHIDDGGCSIITVFYDPATRHIDTMCNFDISAPAHRPH